MKTPKAALLLCALAFASAARGDDTGTAVAASGSAVDTLVFAGGGEWDGTFLGFDKEGVHWRRPDAKDPTLHPTGNVVEVRFDSHAPPPGATPPGN